MGLLWKQEAEDLDRLNLVGQGEGAATPSSCQCLRNKVRISLQVFTTEAQPAESLHTEVPENYGGNFPFYILKVSRSAGWLPITPNIMLLLPIGPVLSPALDLL